MSSLGIGRGSSTRTVRKIEPPRPLKTTANAAATHDTKKPSLSSLILPAKAIDSAEKLLLLMDAVVTGIMSDDETSLKPENKSLLTANIVTLCESLKVSGPQLETSLYRGQLDRAFLTFREGMVRNNLELEARVHLLDILELRECNWLPRKNSKPIIVKNFIRPSDEDAITTKLQNQQPESTAHLGADEVIKSSVQPTFKERLVQITGPNEEKISYATQLIEDTIRNNSSPVREFADSEFSCSSDESYEKQVPVNDNSANWNWSSDTYQYKHKVTYKDCVLMVTGNDYDFVTLAKEVLDDYFSKLDQPEAFDIYSGSENVIGGAGDYLENDVFVDADVICDDTVQEFPNHNGAGDTEEDPLLEQLHKELNSLEVDPEFESSPANEIISISDSLEEIEEQDESAAKDINFPRYVYTREFLLGCRKKSICQREPENFDKIKENFPKIIKSYMRRSSTPTSTPQTPVKSENNTQSET